MGRNSEYGGYENTTEVNYITLVGAEIDNIVKLINLTDEDIRGLVFDDEAAYGEIHELIGAIKSGEISIQHET